MGLVGAGHHPGFPLETQHILTNKLKVLGMTGAGHPAIPWQAHLQIKSSTKSKPQPNSNLNGLGLAKSKTQPNPNLNQIQT